MISYKLTKNRTLNLIQDSESHDHPRTSCENLGTIINWHTRFNLGDENINPKEYTSLNDIISKNTSKDDICLPLFLYNHSSLSLSTKPFNCRFDSSQIGIIKVSKTKIRKEYSCKKVTKKIKEKVIEVLKNEILYFDKYLKGEFYILEILDNNKEIEESCAGFVGDNPIDNGMIDHLSKEDQEYVKSQVLCNGKLPNELKQKNFLNNCQDKVVV